MAISRIIIDTREQLPLWGPDSKQLHEISKLDEGDYTTAKLKEKFHIERKSPGDLYCSIIQGHERFRAELIRAKQKGIKLAILVECPLEHFIQKKFPMGRTLRTKGIVLRKIMITMSKKYGVTFYFCHGREHMRNMAINMFEIEEKKHAETTRD